jgi:deoxyribodipyrimidine photo-lyase
MTNKAVNIFWFRRDLRLEDNAGLYQALNDKNPVLPLFIFDKNILNHLTDKSDRRVEFIHNALSEIHEQLIANGSSIEVVYDTPEQAFRSLSTKYQIEKVYTNHDYEGYARDRDTQIKIILAEKNIELFTFKDQVIFEKEEVIKDDGKPYTVFTPFSRKWKLNAQYSSRKENLL